ncbi:MAG: class I SAM-dependent methyltransferase [Candidatus Latescibacteria bacterium]|nr:class I SAM-dependent methyltransferase [Candidatus Latescibacterota bacterium]MBT4136984.1 class I SAM-dependent methyltransferase [Candidatus Latescibacterota bacterium]MBT5833135.1 class I SAM-dependent methyltransferase [Candidatus Latescibacterota bacterium]
MFKNNWNDYYRHLGERKPRPLFLNALGRFSDQQDNKPRQAIELGSGDGTESLFLLEHGWHVFSVDQELGAIARLEKACRPEWRDVLKVKVTPFEGISLPKAEFIYAGFSLPFCTPAVFPELWTTIVDALIPSGRFAGQLFGERDSWAANPDMSFHTRKEVDALLEPLEVESLEVDERDGKAFSGPKHWHIHHIIARKP